MKGENRHNKGLFGGQGLVHVTTFWGFFERLGLTFFSSNFCAPIFFPAGFRHPKPKPIFVAFPEHSQPVVIQKCVLTKNII